MRDDTPIEEFAARVEESRKSSSAEVVQAQLRARRQRAERAAARYRVTDSRPRPNDEETSR